ncbi:MAG TPA: phosphoenolpyruvate--protein phosphotransferase [Ktedonobacterales bacterium]
MTWKIVRALTKRGHEGDERDERPARSASPTPAPPTPAPPMPAPPMPAPPAGAPPDEGRAASDAPAATTLRGIAVSAGSATGPALIYRGAEEPAAPEVRAVDAPALSAEERAAERARLLAALDAASADLRALAERTRREVGAAEGDIFEAQAMMLEDVTLRERAEALLAEGTANAPGALRQAAGEQAAKLEALPDLLWQARAADVRDAARRALARLTGGPAGVTLEARLATLAEPVVLLAEDLAPSDTAQLRRDRVAGIALARGSATSHAAILARALGIPAVVGLGARLLAEAREGARVILDTATASVNLAPSEAERQAATTAAARWSARATAQRRASDHWRGRPGALRDGTPVPLLANAGSRADAQLAAQYGAEGIGLLRTEFVFAEASEPPDAEQQAATYLEIISALGAVSGPVIVRTLDAGADKPLRSLRAPAGEGAAEANPALGVRGIRLQRARRPLLEAQLRGLALLRARTDADLRVMLPMITTIEETRDAQAALAAQQTALGGPAARPIPLGIMVETPAAVLMAPAFATEVAFFSAGTNDLTQYVMAGDRLNPAMTDLLQPLQPAVVHALAALVSAARPAGRHVGVCGEMAADPRMALLLVGLGVSDLSMNPVSIPAVKATLAAYSTDEAQALAARALAAVTLAAVQAAVAEIRVEEP